MNKRLVALAIAFTPASVLADDSTVSIYGKISVGVETAKAEGATNPALNIKSRARVTEQASYIGFRGLEPLGGDLNAFFQIESLVKPDSPPGRTTVSTAAFASRNSGVGLRGAFGEIMLGRWDTYYTNHVPAGDTLFVKSSYSATVLALFGGTAGLGGQVAALGSGNTNEGRGLTDFGGRRNDVVRYLTPKFGGFSGKITYVAPEGTAEYTATSPAVIAGLVNPGKAKDEGLELSLTYLNPSIGFFNVSHYKRKDFLGVVGTGPTFGTMPGNDSTSMKLAVGTKLAGFTIGLLGERLKHENSDIQATLANESVHRERDAYGVLLIYETGPWAVGTTYAKARKIKDKVAGTTLADTGAKFWQVTGNYNLSKRTTIYATAAKVTNEPNAMYDFFAQSAISDSGPSFIAPGSDPTSFIIGINHFF